MATGEFHLFPNLPTELRLKIWTQTISRRPSLLPRTADSTNDALRSTCRESRLIHRETFTPIFLPLARTLFKRPLSRYANLATDATLYIDDVEILRKDFSEWIASGPKGKGSIKELAIDEQVWRLRGPTRGDAILESRGDARFMMLNPSVGLDGLEVLTLVVKGAYTPHMESELERRAPEEWRRGGMDDLEHKELLGDVRHVFKTLNNLERMGLYAGWKEPELKYASIRTS